MASPSGPKWLDVFDSPYSNGSNSVANAFLLALICISLVVCVAVSWRTRRCIPFSLVMCVAYLLEMSAYALRFQPWEYARYSAEVALFTIAPVFVTIGIHLSTAEVLTTLGPEHAPLPPKTYLRVFIWADIATLLVQAVGLGLTFSGARGAGPWGLLLAAQGHTGQTIVFVGLLLQTLTLAAALALLAVTYVRAGRADRQYGSYANPSSTAAYAHHHHHTHPHQQQQPPRGGPTRRGLREKTFLVALPLAAACVLVRCAYRAAAAWGGLGSAPARDAVLWLVVEGVLLTEAMVSLAVCHPALWVADDNDNNNNNNSNNSNANIGRRRQRPAGDVDVEVGVLGVGGPPSLGGKRLSSGTTLTMADTVGGGGGGVGVGVGMARNNYNNNNDSRHNLAEMNQLMFSPNLIAPSDAGSSETPGPGSRRGSWGQPGPAGAGVLAADPYYRYEDHDGSGSGQQSPYDPPPPPLALGARRGNYSPDMTAETHVLSPVAADEEDEEEDYDRLDVESFVLPPRKSSKRISIPRREVLGQQQDEEDDEEHEEQHDRLEVESFVQPPRKSSKRKSLVMRQDTTDSDRLEVASFVLPPRKPSKRDTVHGREEDLDSVSLYSQ